jgi:hemolysin III
VRIASQMTAVGVLIYVVCAVRCGCGEVACGSRVPALDRQPRPIRRLVEGVRVDQERRTWIKDPFSGMSHAVGAVLSIVGLVVLMIAAHGRPWQTVSFAIYGVSMIVLYTSSAIYHSLHVGPRATMRLQKMDHINIFVLIAGSYTPICLVALRGGWGWSILGVEYALAALGITLTACFRKPVDWLRVALYIITGWLAIIAIGPLQAALPSAAIWWLLAGGITYSVGTIVYGSQRPCLWPGKFDAHDLWHLFVMGGSACHFILVLCFLA